MVQHIKVEELRDVAPTLRAGQRVLLSGDVFTARDAAHARMSSEFSAVDTASSEFRVQSSELTTGEDDASSVNVGSTGNSELRILNSELVGGVIYYAGPTPAPPGFAIGSCGPTTSARMDKFAPRLFDMGLAATIGKGEVSADVVEAIKRNKAVYFAAIGGAGALISRHVTHCEEVAFTDLGAESVKRLTLDALPLTVAVDCQGGCIFH